MEGKKQTFDMSYIFILIVLQFLDIVGYPLFHEIYLSSNFKIARINNYYYLHL